MVPTGARYRFPVLPVVPSSLDTISLFLSTLLLVTEEGI